MKRVLLTLVLIPWLAGCGVFNSLNADVNREENRYDEPLFAESGPDILIDALGEPDETTQSSDNGKLRMTAVWHCVDGNYREVTWESRQGELHRTWVMIDDVSRDCAAD